MAYDQALAQRVRGALAGQPGLSERAMFGGIGFMVHGNMCCGVHGDRLIVRIPPDQHEAALERPGVHTFDMTRRPTKGWILVGPGGVNTPEALNTWVQEGVAFASSLPPK